jgi:hypothetical protein
MPRNKLASVPSTQDQRYGNDFLSEFGTMVQSPTDGYENDEVYGYRAGVNTFVRGPSVRTTYAPFDASETDN